MPSYGDKVYKKASKIVRRGYKYGAMADAIGQIGPALLLMAQTSRAQKDKAEKDALAQQRYDQELGLRRDELAATRDYQSQMLRSRGDELAQRATLADRENASRLDIARIDNEGELAKENAKLAAERANARGIYNAGFDYFTNQGLDDNTAGSRALLLSRGVKLPGITGEKPEMSPEAMDALAEGRTDMLRLLLGDNEPPASAKPYLRHAEPSEASTLFQQFGTSRRADVASDIRSQLAGARNEMERNKMALDAAKVIVGSNSDQDERVISLAKSIISASADLGKYGKPGNTAEDAMTRARAMVGGGGGEEQLPILQSMFERIRSGLSPTRPSPSPTSAPSSPAQGPTQDEQDLLNSFMEANPDQQAILLEDPQTGAVIRRYAPPKLFTGR